MQSNFIFLWGYMGAGKSTLGKQLAEEIGWQWLDLDQEIEKRTKRKIANLILEDGEIAFRKIEAEVLANIVSSRAGSEQIILSCGGGTPIEDESRVLMLEHGKCIYLHMRPLALARRLKDDWQERPILKSLMVVDVDDEDAPAEEQEVNDHQLARAIRGHLKYRIQQYNLAHLTVDGEKASVKNVLEMIRLLNW